MKMRIWLACGLAALGAAAGAQTPGYPGPGQGSVAAARRDAGALESRLRQLEIQARGLKQQLDVANARVSAGMATASELTPLQTALEQSREDMSQAMASLVEARRLLALAKPVDVYLKSASIRQAAEGLSRVSRMKIAVDPATPKAVYVKARAKGVPLGAVLEVIASAAKLTIAPGEGGGLILRPTGQLSINGKSVSLQGDIWPWSDEWASAPRVGYSPLGRRWLWLYDRGGAPAVRAPAKTAR